MPKYVQVRYNAKSDFLKSLKHDLRKNKPSYLRDDLYHNQFSNVYMHSFSEAKMEAEKKLEDFRKRYKNRTGRNPQPGRQSAFFESVMTLSNTIIEELKQGKVSKKELDEIFINAVQEQLDEIERLTGVRPEIVNYAIHYDEKTPHMHFLMTNYDEEGKSIWHRLRTKDKLSRLQDTVGESFSKLRYRRGKKKEQTKAGHKNIRQMHEAEIAELNNTISRLKQEVKEIQANKKELKQEVMDKEKLKEELDRLDKQLKIKREEQKELKDDIKRLKEEKANSVQVNVLGKENLEKIYDECIEIKRGRWWTKEKVVVKDQDKLERLILVLNQKNIPKELLEENQELKQKISTYKAQNQTQSDEIEKRDRYIAELKKELSEAKEEISRLKVEIVDERTDRKIAEKALEKIREKYVKDVVVEYGREISNDDLISYVESIRAYNEELKEEIEKYEESAKNRRVRID